MRRLLAAVVALLLVGRAAVHTGAQTDLDALMRDVLGARDENWKKLQQYILDEREQIELRGSSRQPIWGERRDYTWYIRDGYFVRSPVTFNGAAVPEGDRREYEAKFLKREQERERRRGRGGQGPGSADASVAADSDATAGSIDGLLRQTHEPGFISTAYFLRFKFESGKYALVGRETVDGHEALRIEYYPARLFSHEQDRQQRRAESGKKDGDRALEAEMERMFNKVSLVTLWVEPSSHQILKYTFKNIDADFLPARWLVRIGDVTASMSLGQPFPDVWLPRQMEIACDFALAAGSFDLRYATEFRDYRQPDVKTSVRPVREP